MRRIPVTLGVLAFTGAVIAIGTLMPRADPSDPTADAAALARNMDPHTRGAEYGRNYTRLIEVLPNARHTAGDPVISDSVVLGSVEKVRSTPE